MTRARLLLAALAMVACAETVREDRTVNWSAEGDRVGFQHGDAGVFVADGEGGKLERIFTPGEKVVASSTPLWSPDGEAVIFAAARARDESGFDPRLQRMMGMVSNPAGDHFVKLPVDYTCYLRRSGGEPVALFEASCDHVGYVAANLAVRWHPDGGRVYFLDDEALYAYELETQKRTKVLDKGAGAMIFDWTPKGRRLVCLLGSEQQRPQDGLWIAEAEGEWWHAPLALGTGESLIERLRAARPAVTRDGLRFAYVDNNTRLMVGEFQERTPRVAAESEVPMRDLQWHKDGRHLGVIVGDALRIYAPDSGLGEPVSTTPVSRFAGWSAVGDRYAYLGVEKLPYAPEECWSFLLWPDPLARNTVHVDGKEVFAGMRVTFPTWSPREDKLSLWFTFHPTHRSAVSRILGWGLRPGDPAAIFEPDTGKIGWMAVNAFEEIQIGHYYLLKRDAKTAWEWYEKAAQGETEAEGQPREFPLFTSICLQELGRNEEAQEHLARFEKRFVPPSEGTSALRFDAGAFDVETFEGKLVRALYAAEVFLSLDRMEEGVAFFQAPVKDTDTQQARTIALSQLMLLQNKYAEYADLAAAIAPDLMQRTPGENLWSGLLLEGARHLEFAPLTTQAFVTHLEKAQVERLLKVWAKLPASERYVTSFRRRLGLDASKEEEVDLIMLEQIRSVLSARW